MSIRPSAKKVVFAAFMAAPLFLAACGSDESSSEVASSSTTTASTTASSSASSTASSSTAASSSATTAPATSAAAEPADGAAQQAEIEALSQELSENPITFAELAPVENGQAASPEDSAAIESLIRGASQATTLRSSLGYMLNNTCTRVLEQSGGTGAIDLNTIPDVPLSGEGTGTVDSVSDIAVNGETASAWVVATAGDQTDSGTQRFLREGGQWKFCD
ncbi:hypothetical protein SFC07_01820 [Corynebacterium callunae]|uniref:hypothetical protein n=1 Tax=Corynebacterium callunae TaxID=1721 RepID=UPI0039824254